VLGLAVAGFLIAPHSGSTPGTAAPVAAESSSPASSPPGSGIPVRLRIATIAVDSPLETLGLDGAGALETPRDFAHAGWFAAGTAPGEVGPAVIAGHVDSKHGRAVFYRLHELRAGDAIGVERGGRWIGFRVVTTGRYTKSDFPTDEVYGPTPGPELRLITCGGTFDRTRGSYRDNIVVYAIATG
jgi:hypothetical protein